MVDQTGMAGGRLAIGSTGGTITMTDRGGDGLAPSLGAEDLVALVPELAGADELTVATLTMKPGASLQFGDVVRYLQWADRAVTDGADGVVLIQGTDTLEETAYLLDLYWDRPQPLVLTGAMRSPGTHGADGVANLAAAARVALSAAARDLGVLVTMNAETHAARRVGKRHTGALDAFRSPNGGPLGRIDEGEVRLLQRVVRRRPIPPPVPDAVVRVPLLQVAFGDDPAWLRSIQPDDVDGLVVNAFGAGHVPEWMVPTLARLADAVPVVLASRTGAGSVNRRTYGFAGSERDLIDRGLIPAGYLDAHKARLLLWAALASYGSKAALRTLFDEHGTA